MEVEASAAMAQTGGEVSVGGVDLQAMLDGEAPSQPESTPAETAPTPESAEPQEPVEAKSEEPVEAKAEETPADKTAEEYSEPLPGKLGKLLEAVAKTSPDLARQIRADHEALNGPEGFRGMFRTVEEAREYKSVAPTVDDLKVMADYTGRFQRLDGEYEHDPARLVHTLARDENNQISQQFNRFVQEFEPALRAEGDDRLYESAAKPFNQNFWRNVMATAQREGTPEEVELFRAFEQKYLGGLAQGQSAPTSQFQNTPEWRELQQLRAERAQHQGQSHESFFNDVNREITPGLRSEVRKYLDEKAGTGLPEDIRDEMAQAIANGIFSEINGNPIVRSELQRMIEGGDLSPQHKQMVIDRVMTRARAYMPTKSAPEIRRWSDRMRKLSGGNGNATTTTTTQTRSKDVGSGSPTVGTAKGGPMPKGAPPGFNNMKPDEQSRFINWRAMGEDAELLVIEAKMSGDWSKVVMKGQ